MSTSLGDMVLEESVRGEFFSLSNEGGLIYNDPWVHFKIPNKYPNGVCKRLPEMVEHEGCFHIKIGLENTVIRYGQFPKDFDNFYEKVRGSFERCPEGEKAMLKRLMQFSGSYSEAVVSLEESGRREIDWVLPDDVIKEKNVDSLIAYIREYEEKFERYMINHFRTLWEEGIVCGNGKIDDGVYYLAGYSADGTREELITLNGFMRVVTDKNGKERIEKVGDKKAFTLGGIMKDLLQQNGRLPWQ